MSYDVIVVGGGPSGSTAARHCASNGLKTLVIDRAEFPRDKPCGGGVLVRTAREMGIDISPVVERTVSTAVMVRKSGKVDSISSRGPLCYMTRRIRFDAYLLEQARAAGATVMQRTTLKGIEQGSESVEITAGGSERLSARMLIAADGANGSTARLGGLRTDLMQAVALEANLAPRGGIPSRWQSAGGVYSIGCPGGYGWIFPKGDHLNVGVAGWEYAAPTLRRRLFDFTRACGFDPEALAGMRGHRIPFRRPGSPLVARRIMLVGDAAGLADPLTGDGIYSAVVSGKAAARTAVEFVNGRVTDLSGYQRSMESGLAASDRIAMQVHDLVHLGMDQFFWSVARVPLLWRACCAIARGEFTYRTAKERLGPWGVLIDLGADLVRVAPWLQRRTGRVEDVRPERFFRSLRSNATFGSNSTSLARPG